MLEPLVIDRQLWGKGTLLHNDGRMCCLGHLSAACGISNERMAGKGYPLQDWLEVPSWAREVSRSAGGAGEVAALINDSTLPAYERETKLIALFAEHGIALSFIGESRE